MRKTTIAAAVLALTTAPAAAGAQNQDGPSPPGCRFEDRYLGVDAIGTAVYYDGRWVAVDELWLRRGAGFHLIDLCPTVAAGRVIQVYVELRGIPGGFERRTDSDGSPVFDDSLLELVDRAARRGASSAVFTSSYDADRRIWYFLQPTAMEVCRAWVECSAIAGR